MIRGIFKHKFLIAIFLLAFFIRTYDLSSRPMGFHMDEVANTYVGRFILTNGVDLYGNKWPVLYFNKFGDYPPVLPMYLSGFATYIFGVNEFAARFPSALFGSLIIFPIYILVNLFASRKFALLSVLIITILPWHVILSRASSEGIIGLTVVTFGLAVLFNGITRNKRSFVLYSWAFFAISYLIYPSFRLLVPMFLFPLPFIFKK